MYTEIHPQITQIVYHTNLCNLWMAFMPFFAFEFAALKETDQFADFSDHGHRSDPVSLHQFLRVIESCVWFDEEPWRDRSHDVAGACEVPAFAWQRL